MIDENRKTILLTGAAGYIGSEFVLKLQNQANFILVDSNQIGLGALLNKLPKNDKNHIFGVDLADPNSRASSLDEIIKTIDHLDVLINCAAYTGSTSRIGWVSDFEAQSLTTWREAIEVNLTACFEFSQKLVPKLRKSEDGNILNISSIYGLLGPDMSLYEGTSMGNPAAYAVSKGGLIQLTRWLSTVLAPEIRVNCISPGGVFRGQPDSFIEAYQKKVPLGRMASEADIIGAMEFLTFGSSKYVTGQNLVIDGGFSAW